MMQSTRSTGVTAYMSGTRHSVPGHRPHIHPSEAFTVKFQTISPDKLPARAAFGKDPIFSQDDVTEAVKQLRAGVAISDGETYAERKQAHNRAGVLAARIKKNPAHPKIATTAVKDGDKYRWWISPKKTG